MSNAIKDATRSAITQGIQDVMRVNGGLSNTVGCITELEEAITTRLLESVREKVVLANDPPESELLRYCGDQPGDDWVKRVERLNAIIDGMNGRGEAVGGAIVGTVVV